MRYLKSEKKKKTVKWLALLFALTYERAKATIRICYDRHRQLNIWSLSIWYENLELCKDLTLCVGNDSSLYMLKTNVLGSKNYYSVFDTVDDLHNLQIPLQYQTLIYFVYPNVFK